MVRAQRDGVAELLQSLDMVVRLALGIAGLEVIPYISEFVLGSFTWVR